MRLGATTQVKPFSFRVETVNELDALVEKLDRYGLSTIASPIRTPEMSDEECIEFGEKTAQLGIVISEVHFFGNLMAPDAETRQKAIETGRALLRKANLMRARCLLGFAGGTRSSGHGIYSENYTKAFRSELREMLLRVLDGIEVTSTKYGLEASPNTFFYEPEGCAQLIDEVDHPDFGMHLDMTNMVSQVTILNTTELIGRTFELLGDRIWSAHLKDVTWDSETKFTESGHRTFVHLDEANIGDGEMDYPTLLGHLAKMDPDFPCVSEHLSLHDRPDEDSYILNINRLHKLADELGVPFVRRTAPRVLG